MRTLQPYSSLVLSAVRSGLVQLPEPVEPITVRRDGAGRLPVKMRSGGSGKEHWATDKPIQDAVAELKRRFPDLMVPYGVLSRVAFKHDANYQGVTKFIRIAKRELEARR